MREFWKTRGPVLLGLQLLLIVFSLSNVFSKLAGRENFLSVKFCIYYGLDILVLGIYAICWQQIIKRLPLTLAFASRAVTLIWGLFWGYFIFHERITVWKLIGAALVAVGVILFATDPAEEGGN